MVNSCSADELLRALLRATDFGKSVEASVSNSRTRFHNCQQMQLFISWADMLKWATLCRSIHLFIMKSLKVCSEHNVHPSIMAPYANLKTINRGLCLFVKNWICSFILRIEPHQKVSVKTNIKIFVCETYSIDACTCKGIQKITFHQ